ncbi:MAG TPA: hypothetical protein VKR59_14000 [Terriglobales bacterium]|nr:hypothetical protein [Terriglobales bacterium]
MSSHPKSQRVPSLPAKLVTIVESEIGELSRFIAAQSGREAGDVESHLRWFLLENPARETDIPLGCGLRSTDGELVGCILCVPQRFRHQQQVLTVMGSSSFYVDERYRGGGGLLFLKFSEFGRRWPLFGNSANADAAGLWKARGAKPIPFSDHELFGVLHWEPVIEESLHRKGVGAGFLSRLAARAGSAVAGITKGLKVDDEPGNLSPLYSADEVIALLIDALPIHEPPTELTAARDRDYIRWRYFSNRDKTVAVFAFRSPRFAGPTLVTVNQRLRGYRQQIKTLNLLDVYPPVNPEMGAAIANALVVLYRAHHRDTVDAIVLRGLDQQHQAVFLAKGFVRRQFEAPNGWLLDKTLLDKTKILPTQNLYLVPADGDWLI